jgi:Calcineurin-like phosphoesterase
VFEEPRGADARPPGGPIFPRVAAMTILAPALCAIGDTHGHLQLALCVAARWQRGLGVSFDAVLLCGDVGSFTEDSQLDSTTRRHGKANPCELEFLHQWAARPQSEWLRRIFLPADEGGLGLTCPVVMVHGNHEGFPHLRQLAGDSVPDRLVAPAELPRVDTAGHILYLPSGWGMRTSSGLTVAGVGGIERGQRYASYHDLAYLDEAAILHLLEQPPVDVLITHQGPNSVQGDHGSPALQALLDAEIAKVWFHGHSIPNREITCAGPNGSTLVVPLGDVAFPGKGPTPDDPGEDGWACVSFSGLLAVRRERPAFWREYRRRRWHRRPDGQLVCPDLA